MITKVSASNVQINNYKNNQTSKKEVSFSGLTDRMGKKVYNGFYDMSALFPKDHMQSPIVGKLPGFMIKKIQYRTQDVKTAVMEVFDAFAKTCNELRDYKPNSYSKISELHGRRSDTTVENLKEVLTKWGIISKFDDFDIKYIDKGGKGAVYKFEGLRHVHDYDEDEFVMKVFHSKSVQTNAYHGCFPEMNAAAYWMKRFGFDTNRGKFFWGDVKEAYMINKFIDEDVRLPKKKPDPYNNGMKFTDEDPIHIHNVCKGYSYDWGGGVVINQVVNSNKFARKIMNDVKNSTERFRLLNWYGWFSQKPKGNNDCKTAGLALAIKYLKPDDRIACFEQCFRLRGKYTDRALAYTLKYMPHDFAKHYYNIFAKSSKDNVLKKILYNEIPMLSLKDECMSKLQDDLIVMDNIYSSDFRKYINFDKFNEYCAIISKYIHKES